MFYEVNFDEETRIMFEGQASGAIAKGSRGGGTTNFIPDDALDNSLDLAKKVALRIATEVAPVVDGTVCSMEIEFGIRADGNGVVTREEFRAAVARGDIGAGSSDATRGQ